VQVVDGRRRREDEAGGRSAGCDGSGGAGWRGRKRSSGGACERAVSELAVRFGMRDRLSLMQCSFSAERRSNDAPPSPRRVPEDNHEDRATSGSPHAAVSAPMYTSCTDRGHVLRTLACTSRSGGRLGGRPSGRTGGSVFDHPREREVVGAAWHIRSRGAGHEVRLNGVERGCCGQGVSAASGRFRVGGRWHSVPCIRSVHAPGKSVITVKTGLLSDRSEIE
jgi:hypothetical protein